MKVISRIYKLGFKCFKIVEGMKIRYLGDVDKIRKILETFYE